MKDEEKTKEQLINELIELRQQVDELEKTKTESKQAEEDRKARTRNRCNGEGYESVALIPLRSGGEIIGLLQLNDRRRNLFKPEIIYFCEGLGASIGITLSRKKAEKEQEKLILEFQEALAKVKTLSKLLPICASCKKIRDDKGYWSEIEEYISEHTDTLFSHGMCPDCMKKMYPDFYKKEE